MGGGGRGDGAGGRARPLRRARGLRPPQRPGHAPWASFAHHAGADHARRWTTSAITSAGKGGHARLPHDAVDPIPGACALVSALQTIVSRNADPMTAARGLGDAGPRRQRRSTSSPTRRYITGTVRSFDPARAGPGPAPHRGDRRRARPPPSGSRPTLDYQIGYPPTVNDPGRTAFAAEVAREVAGDARSTTASPRARWGPRTSPSCSRQRPGAYLFLGNGDTPGLPPPGLRLRRPRRRRSGRQLLRPRWSSAAFPLDGVSPMALEDAETEVDRAFTGEAAAASPSRTPSAAPPRSCAAATPRTWPAPTSPSWASPSTRP